MEIISNQINFTRQLNADSVGIFASILCAIHCAATPVLLLMMPTFGKMWAHPATHWGMAIVVIPIAVFMMLKGFREHGKKWILGIGILGVLFIIVGAILPYSELGTAPAVSSSAAAQKDIITAPNCIDNCCPSIMVNESGEKSLYIPPASIVTTLGGICLIIVHSANLCCSLCSYRCKVANNARK